MKTGIYKDRGGGEQDVIEVDEVGNRMLVDYGNGKTVWYGAEDYSTWTFVDNQEVVDVPHETFHPSEDLGEQVLDYQEPPIIEETETISEVPDNPIAPEKPLRKRTPAKKPVATTKPKPKKK